MITAPVHRVTGTAVPLRGNDLDTDRIIPARFLTAVPLERLGTVVFADDRSEVAESGAVHPFDDLRYAGARVLLVERNFGCGSSREHAISALAGWRAGIGALVGTSFADIFRSNALANGIPCATADGQTIERLFAAVEDEPGTALVLDVEQAVVDVPGLGWSSPVQFGPGSRERFLDGTWDPLERLLATSAAVTTVAGALPYHRWAPPIQARP